MTNCKEIMCKYNLNSKEEVKQWILANHPDKQDHPNKDPNVTEEIYKNDMPILRDCMKDEKFCNVEGPKLKVTKKNRGKIFSCMRKTANFGKITNYHKFDKTKVFDPEKLKADLAEASPKIIQLMNNIAKLDELDQQNHNKKFKHFIFSDVKEGGYGAKILASAFQAFNYNNVIQAKKVEGVQKLKLYIDAPNSESNFGLLCSNSIYNSNFNEKLKKELLKLFNSRPDNIYGKKLRFIIFDSGFKEGIDLFDVKYVHIFEPSMTIADLKQTVGRATRTCGQKGLDFQDGVGWPLYVYNYYLTAPDITQETMAASKFLTYNIEKPEKDEDIFIFKNIEKVNDATMLYSNFDKAMNNLSQQLFELAASLSTDYSLTKNLHNVEDLNMEFMEKDFYLKGGTKDVFKKINKKSKYFQIDLINCKGNCGAKTTNDVPVSLDFMKRVYKKYGHPNKYLPKTNQRKALCNYMYSVPQYCQQLNYEWNLRYAYVPQAFEKKNTKENLDDLELEPGSEESIDKDYDSIDYEGKKTPIKTPRSNPFVPNTKLSFNAMRDFIKTAYAKKEFIWEPLVIENKCVPKPGEKPKEAHEVDLNPTQNFVSHFFCPESPYKGLLLWHSVGTGKTCTGVATASSSFERQGYNILWVTRTTLKSDVWKNIFDQICHSILKEEVKLGLTLPEKLNDRKKLLSDRWLEPMSYKQFSNLLLGKNKIYEILKQRNGTEDILKKTLIIIDEAHKLYGGDLKAIERPDTNIMEKLIMNSYKKSGTESCKLLVMTATPFTDSPLELFSLTNLFVTNESEKITTNKEEFKKQYMTNENILSQNGVKNLANKLSGYISYLNREKDPTQFAQPIMINVPVLMTNVTEEKLRDIIYFKKQLEKTDSKVVIKIKELQDEIKKFKADLKAKRGIFKESKTNAKTTCNERYPDAKKQKEERKNCIEELKAEYEELSEEIKELVDEINELQEGLKELKEEKEFGKNQSNDMKEKIRALKKSLIQEYMMYQKCAHLNYVKVKEDSSSKSTSNKTSSKKSSSNKSSSNKSSSNKSSSDKSSPNKSPITKKTKKSKKKVKKTTTTKSQYNSYSN